MRRNHPANGAVTCRSVGGAWFRLWVIVLSLLVLAMAGCQKAASTDSGPGAAEPHAVQAPAQTPTAAPATPAVSEEPKPAPGRMR